MARISSHIIESRSFNEIKRKIDYNGEALLRRLDDRDYGIDAVIELFNDGKPTGMFALVQIKGTEKTIVPLRKSPTKISCQISLSNALYAAQNNIPLLLIYINVSQPESFFYTVLQEWYRPEYATFEQQKITVHIPVDNSIFEDLEPMLEVIREFYLH